MSNSSTGLVYQAGNMFILGEQLNYTQAAQAQNRGYNILCPLLSGSVQIILFLRWLALIHLL